MLDENAMPGKCTVTMGSIYTTVHGDKNAGISYIVTRNTPADTFPNAERNAYRLQLSPVKLCLLPVTEISVRYKVFMLAYLIDPLSAVVTAGRGVEYLA